MEIFLIKKENKIEQIIDDYYFDFIHNTDKRNKFSYYLTNHILPENKTFSWNNFYFNLPFLILSKLLKSFDSKETENFVGSIYLPNRIWTNYFFNEDNILFIRKKYEMFRLLSEEIDIFIECSNENRKIKKDVYENLCNFIIEVQNEFANYINYIEFSQYYCKNQEEEEENLESISYLYKKLYLLKIDSIDYVGILHSLLKKSVKLGSIINTLDMSNYDFLDDSDSNFNFSKEFLINKKFQLSKFFSKVVLRIILIDLKSLLTKHLKIR